MHVGIDVHGVITKHPKFFSRLTRDLREKGHKISIITGQEWEKVKPVVDGFNVVYDDYFSIVDHHKSIGTDMWKDDKNTCWIDEESWNSSKGEYIKRAVVDMHFDDSVEYAKYCPSSCTYVLVSKDGNFENIFMNMAYVTIIV